MRNRDIYKSVKAVLLFVAVVSGASIAKAGGNDDDFEDHFLAPCLAGGVALINAGWTNPEIINYNNAICNNVFNVGTFNSSATYSSSTSTGVSGSQSSSSNATAGQQVSSVKERLEEVKDEESAKSGLGFLLSAQSGGTERVDTLNENGYESDLSGLVAGIDYRFNDNVVAGLAFGMTDDEAEIINGGGKSETSASSLTFYVTYIPVEGAYVDGYIGTSSLEFNNSRNIIIDGEAADAFGFLETANSAFEADQEMIGASVGYDWYIDRFSIGPYLAIDYIKTEIEAYNETGSSGFELEFPEQKASSQLTSLGINLSYMLNQTWGSLVPNFSLAFVNESKDDVRLSNARLVILPDVDTSSFQVRTDEPDRNYILSSIGGSAALNDGTQLFAAYEQISGHDFLDTWAINVGVLMEF